MSDIQRARLLAAIGQVACERGALRVTVAHVVERAGVSRRTFYELFDSCEDCLLAAFDDALVRAAERVLAAWGAEGLWHERVRGALVALLGLFEEQPVLARLLVVELQGAGRVALERRTRALDCLIDALQEGAATAATTTAAAAATAAGGAGAGAAGAGAAGSRSTCRCGGDGVGYERLVAEGVVGGVLAVVQARLGEQDGGAGRMVELVNPLMSMIVLPFLGSAAARRELRRSLPAPVTNAHPSDGASASPSSSAAPTGLGSLCSDPFKDAGMRLTYRTVCVLAAIAERPGASNRLIGERAGATDQGQVSKLLARLARIGLIANTSLGPGQGAPNAWTLTPAGQQVMATIRPHTSEGMIQ